VYTQSANIQIHDSILFWDFLIPRYTFEFCFVFGKTCEWGSFTYEYICTYVQIYTYIYINIHIHMRTNTYIASYAYSHIHMYTQKQMHIYIYRCIFTNTYMNTFTHSMYVDEKKDVCEDVKNIKTYYIHRYVRIYCIHKCTQIHIYIVYVHGYTHTHTYADTNTHTYTHKCINIRTDTLLQTHLHK